MTIVHALVRGGFRILSTSEVVIFLRIVDGFQLLNFITKSITLAVERILYPPLLSVLMSNSILRHKSSLVCKNKSSMFGYFTSIYTCIAQPRSQRTLTFGPMTAVKMSIC